MLKLQIFLLLILSSVFAIPVREKKSANTCGYESCARIDENRVNVHLIPHSHDDAGWLKTVDQYYFGSRNNIQNAGVQYIITSVVEALEANPERRFIQVETVFFWKWWKDQGESMRQSFINLVNSGQIEIINAAWSMNDEAASHYHSIIDQFTWGLRTINQTLGACGRPRIGWQIDPFGHSREHASIVKQIGFDALVIGRLDFRDKLRRQLEKDLDHLWQTSNDLDDTLLFTTMFPEFYGTIGGLCWDIACGDSPINDDVTSPDYNLDEKVDILMTHLNVYQAFYKTKNIMVPMGGDFNYQAAESNYLNIDKLIRAVKDDERFNVFYSTPSCYLKAVNDEVIKKKIKLSVKSDDFFPYASDPQSFWGGYFTSRPASKRFERLGNNILQATKQLATFSKLLGKDIDASLTPLRETMGIMQHHDAITGTEKQEVSRDYHRLLSKAINTAEEPISDVIQTLLKKNPEADDLDLKFSSCLLANVSICEASKNDRFFVAVYNPLARSVNHYVRLPVEDGVYQVTGSDGEHTSDVLDSLSSFDYIPGASPSPKELVFLASELPPLGLKLYSVERVTARRSAAVPLADDGNVFGTETNGFTIDPGTNLLNSVTINGQKLMITQEFLYYRGAVGDNEMHNGIRNRSSGAYIFRPIDAIALPLSEDPIKITSQRGELVDEVKQVINHEVTQIIRVYKGDKDSFIEFDWLVGDLEHDDETQIGKEIITRFTIEDFTNQGVFYTDSNGRQQIKRVLNKRSDYEYDPEEEPVASNYYPVTSKIVVKDERQGLEVALLNDRAQGGSSLADGVIELMVHRRLLHDDAFGVEEALNEIQFDKGLYVRGQHWLTFGSIAEQGNTVVAYERELAIRKLLQPLVLLADLSDQELTYDELSKVWNVEFQGLPSSLPENVHLLTLEPWLDDSVLLRLEHLFQTNEDESLSKPLEVDLKTLLLPGFDLTEIKETTLGANDWLEDYQKRSKLSWTENSSRESNLEASTSSVSLAPMEIRTFVLKVDKIDNNSL